VSERTKDQRPFRFLAEARAVTSGRALAETARRAEDSGIDVLVVPDHLIDQLAPIPALATIAAATGCGSRPSC